VDADMGTLEAQVGSHHAGQCAGNQEKRYEGTSQGRAGGETQPARWNGRWARPKSREQAFGGKDPYNAECGTDCQNDAYMVRLPDIDEDLLRVQDVVNGDGVETGLEFLEEKVLGEQEEALHGP